MKLTERALKNIQLIRRDIGMSLFHKHNWENTDFTYSWTYPPFDCSCSGYNVSWCRLEVFQKNNPGGMRVKCDDDRLHFRLANPRTVISQKCTCGKYRSQHLDGIIKS